MWEVDVSQEVLVTSSNPSLLFRFTPATRHIYRTKIHLGACIKQSEFCLCLSNINSIHVGFPISVDGRPELNICNLNVDATVWVLCFSCTDCCCFLQIKAKICINSQTSVCTASKWMHYMNKWYDKQVNNLLIFVKYFSRLYIYEAELLSPLSFAEGSVDLVYLPLRSQRWHNVSCLSPRLNCIKMILLCDAVHPLQSWL